VGDHAVPATTRGESLHRILALELDADIHSRCRRVDDGELAPLAASMVDSGSASAGGCPKTPAP
jgi:hypothetical protein